MFTFENLAWCARHKFDPMDQRDRLIQWMFQKVLANSQMYFETAK